MSKVLISSLPSASREFRVRIDATMQADDIDHALALLAAHFAALAADTALERSAIASGELSIEPVAKEG